MNKNIIIAILVGLLLIIGGFMLGKMNSQKQESLSQEKPLINNNEQEVKPVDLTTKEIVPLSTSSSVNLYKNHGFTLKLPDGYIPLEQVSESGPSTSISLPNNSHLNYVSDASFWNQHVIPSYTYIKSQKIGQTTFSVYSYSSKTFYWFQQGNVGYEFYGDTEILKTFSFTGWN